LEITVKQTVDHRRFFAVATVVCALFMGIFYWKYVPIVAGYQLILAPLLILLTIWTAIDIRGGLIAFIFLFPLINNLPYFFKLYEPLPMAPSALVLFLFFFWGWLFHRTFHAPNPVRDGEKPNEPIFAPLRLFAILVGVSALITIWRYTNFFPFWRPRVYELITNAFGTSAGGAIMSVVFYALTYLTGIAFFFILVGAVRSEAFIRKAVTALGASILLSLAFGLFQHFKAPTLGNNPLSISTGLNNATFKDALSFGAFISIILPFSVPILRSFRRLPRLLFGLSVLPASYLLFFAGSKIALLSLLATLSVLGVFGLLAFFKSRQKSAKKLVWIGSSVLILAGLATTAIFLERGPMSRIRDSVLIKRMEGIPWSLRYRIHGPWDIAVRMMREYPASGIGMGSYIIESSNSAKELGKEMGEPESTENLLLQIGSELGVPGVLFFFWILCEIIRRGVRSFRHAPRSSLERALAPAAGAGLLAFFLNSQMHSYIGSYEIQYLFWFLAAVLFTPVAARPCPDKAPARHSPLLQTVGLALVFLGGISLLWDSTHSLSLRERTRKFGLRQEFGLGPVEKTAEGIEFRWSGRFAGTSCRIDGSDIGLSLLASHPDIQIRPVRVKILITPDLGTKPIVLRDLLLKENRWEKIVLAAPASIRGPALLLFETDRTWNPRKSGVSADRRYLGLAIGNLKTSNR
jgi:hypothetical protein